MGDALENTPIRHICMGIVAHVDAGKTTLAEGILYLTGSIRRLGRVDHQDAFLDNFALERARGITIFSKQARLELQGLRVTMVDTPGHVDFSAEMERTLQILDYAVLVISGADGVQSHVETLWRLLKKYGIPTFLFVNKMDQPGTDRERLLEELQRRLSDRCLDFGPEAAGTPEFAEGLALCDEALLERYLETGEVTEEDIAELIRSRKVFPCFFGSALKLEGVEELLKGIRRYARVPEYSDQFGARVYKISRDDQGNRLTHMRITGGCLRVKELLTNRGSEPGAALPLRPEEIWEEKVNQIRVYSGASFQAVNQVEAGEVCAVTGLSSTRSGEGLGIESAGELPVLEPVLSYQIRLPQECDVHQTFRKLLQLEEEEPELHIVWNEELNEIYAQIMGEVQIEVLKAVIRERFGIDAEFGAGNIVYKETIGEPVIGIGHFEPLRHYAEVQLLLEPGEPGSGLQFGTACGEDVLERSWQRLILTHLEEKRHRGVLTGSEITDMRITLLTGRAHQKHTEGGDFRQATYRAVRQGLRRGSSVLLEPVYEFRMELPQESAGRAMTDIQKMNGSFAPMELERDMAILTGQAPVVNMRGYQTELLAYTKGRGRLSCTLKGYEPCHNPEEVMAERGYDPEADLDNPTGSVFCAHGAGFVVNWDLVPEYAHLDGEAALEALWRKRGERPGADTWDAPEAYGGRWPESGDWDLTGQDISETTEQSSHPGAVPNDTAGAGNDLMADSTRNGRSGTTQNDIARAGNGQEPDLARSGRPGASAYGVSGPGSGAGSGANGGNHPVPGRTARRQGVPFQSRTAPVVSDKELEEIFARTYGAPKQERTAFKKSRRVDYGAPSPGPKKTDQEEYLLVDGYNIIFAWEELNELAKVNIDGARTKLMDILSNYQGYKKVNLILVFDAYRVEGGQGSVQKYHNIYVVYTKEAETADQYIEKTVHRIGRKYDVTVATSDALEQVIILGQGGRRLSAAGLREEILLMEQDLRENYLGRPQSGKNYLFDHLDEGLSRLMEEVRLGKKKLK